MTSDVRTRVEIMRDTQTGNAENFFFSFTICVSSVCFCLLLFHCIYFFTSCFIYEFFFAVPLIPSHPCHFQRSPVLLSATISRPRTLSSSSSRPSCDHRHLRYPTLSPGLLPFRSSFIILWS